MGLLRAAARLLALLWVDKGCERKTVWVFGKEELVIKRGVVHVTVELFGEEHQNTDIAGVI